MKALRRPRSRKRLRRALAVLAALLVLGIGGTAVILKVRENRLLYHLRIVERGVLYRSGQMRRAGLERLHDREGIRTIIDLTAENRDDPLVREETDFAREKGLRYLHLPLSDKAGEFGPAVERFLEELDDPGNRPVLLHCWNGVRRTGILTAVYRMEYQRATNAEALAGLTLFRRTGEDFDPAERKFILDYVPRWRRDASPPVPVPASR